jgi:hypothetical protein
MKKSMITIFLSIASILSLSSQTVKYDPDSILLGNRKQPSVMLVGVFHFNYPDLDAHVSAKEDRVNVLETTKQKELQTLLDYIAKFKPTKIAVETGSNTGFLMKYYIKFLSGERNLEKNEIEQIGFRLMQKFNLDTIYGVDALELANSFTMGKDSIVMKPIIDSIYNGWSFRKEYGDTLKQLYMQLYIWEDKLKQKLSLLEYLKLINSEKFLKRSNGVYLTGNFTLDGIQGSRCSYHVLVQQEPAYFQKNSTNYNLIR